MASELTEAYDELCDCILNEVLQLEASLRKMAVARKTFERRIKEALNDSLVQTRSAGRSAATSPERSGEGSNLLRSEA